MVDDSPEQDSAHRASLGLQGTLFDDLPEEERPGGSAQDVGYRDGGSPLDCSRFGPPPRTGDQLTLF